jgi:hypothetical protein
MIRREIPEPDDYIRQRTPTAHASQPDIRPGSPGRGEEPRRWVEGGCLVVYRSQSFFFFFSLITTVWMIIRGVMQYIIMQYNNDHKY